MNIDYEQYAKLLVAFSSTTPIGFIITDMDSDIKLVNQSCAEMFGYEIDELIDKPLSGLIGSAEHPHGKTMDPYVDGVADEFRKVLKHGVVTAKHRSGTKFNVYVGNRMFFKMGEHWYGAAFVTRPNPDNGW